MIGKKKMCSVQMPMGKASHLDIVGKVKMLHFPVVYPISKGQLPGHVYTDAKLGYSVRFHYFDCTPAGLVPRGGELGFEDEGRYESKP